MFAFTVKASIVLVSLATVFYAVYKSRHQQRVLYNTHHTSNFENFYEDSISRCTVCLVDFDSSSRQEVLALPCKHKFHKSCIYNIFKNEIINGKICPYCQKAVSDDFLKMYF